MAYPGIGRVLMLRKRPSTARPKESVGVRSVHFQYFNVTNMFGPVKSVDPSEGLKNVAGRHVTAYPTDNPRDL